MQFKGYRYHIQHCLETARERIRWAQDGKDNIGAAHWLACARQWIARARQWHADMLEDQNPLRRAA